MIICSVQDAVILLTLFKYLLALIVSLLHKTSIDGSIFTCTTCIVYQYFKELVAFVLKAGAKVRALFLTTKLFRKFFFSVFLFYSISLALYAKGKECMKEELAGFLCESDCKDKNFIQYYPNFFGSFLFFSLSGIPLFH